MSNVTVKPYGEYLNFGNCLEIANDKVSLLVTVDVGPRIIRASLKGSDTNMMKNDVDRDTQQGGSAHLVGTHFLLQTLQPAGHQHSGQRGGKALFEHFPFGQKRRVPSF